MLIRIMIGLILGVLGGSILGAVLQEDQLARVLDIINPFGQVFLRLLFMIMVPVIFSTLIVGAASVNPKQLGRIGIRIFLIYVFTSFIAVSTGLIAGVVFRPHVDLSGMVFAEYDGAAAATPPLSTLLLGIIPNNIVTAVAQPPNLLGIIFFTLCFGSALALLRESDNPRTKNAAETVFAFFDGCAEVIIKMVKGIMHYAPIGVFALIANVFATAGPQVAGGLAMVVVAMVSGFLAYAIVWYLLVCVKIIGGLSIPRFLMNSKEAFFTGFVTRSSAATMPITLECASKLGIPKNVYSFSIPLGTTINMDGTAIYQGVAAMFMAYSVWGHGLDAGQIGIVLLMGTFATLGAAGVPGAGAIMLLMVLTQLGMPVEAGTAAAAAYAMILGIDAILDMFRTSLNVTGDLVYNSMLCRRMGSLEMEKWA